MLNGLSMRKWLKGAHMSGVQEGSPAALRRWDGAEMGWNVLGLVWDVLEGRFGAGPASWEPPVRGRPAEIHRWLPAHRPNSQPPLQDVSHQSQDISTHFSPIPSTYDCRRPLPNTAHMSTFEPFPHTKLIWHLSYLLIQLSILSWIMIVMIINHYHK